MIRRIIQWMTGAFESGPTVEFSTWGSRALDVAQLLIGLGEEGGNNQGPDIDMLRRGRKVWGGGEWCADAMSFAVEDSYALLLGFHSWDMLPPSATKRCLVKRTGSARKLWRRIAKAGSIVEHPMPGDFALFKRKGGHHICMVERVSSEMWTSIDGNRGRYNWRTKIGAKIRVFNHEYNEPEFVGFARLPDRV